MTPEELIKLLEERGDVVYVIDKGLIRFGKFAFALLAMFGLIGAFFFGLDIKKASDEAKQARFDTEKTLLELKEAKSKLTSQQDELNQSMDKFKNYVTESKHKIQTSLDEVKSSNEWRTMNNWPARHPKHESLQIHWDLLGN